ncbi:class I SAM-dependent methyltransferase [Chloroflexota bacterium]
MWWRFFTLPAARIAGENGKVYGLDVNPNYIHELEKLALKEKLDNLYLTVGEAEKVVLCDSCVDIIFFGVVLHDFYDAARVLGNARAMLKPTGRLVNLDWKKKPMDMGPTLKKRFSVDDAAKLIMNAGLSVENKRDIGPYHYMIIASK